MKTNIVILVLVLTTSFFSVQAQRTVTTTRATSYDISDNLDLEAVASIFGDSQNLEDFEHRLNNPDNRISNLDLNEDGYIDYLRVLENSSDRNTLVLIQAVLDQDVFQDVATIEIEKQHNGNPRVQVVGDSYIYGSNYIIEPVYVHTPLIFSLFWSPRYVSYHSPYYWNYYPSWYSYYRPYPTYRYNRHIDVHINMYHSYHHTNTRNIHFSEDRYNQMRRSDYAARYPNRTFSSRNEGLRNKQELNARRPGNTLSRQRNTEAQRSGNGQFQNNNTLKSGRNSQQRDVIQNRRPGSDVQSGTNQTRSRENSNVNSSRTRPASTNAPVQIKSGNSREREVIQNRRPGSNVQSGANQTRTRENSNVNSSQTRSASADAPVQIKSGKTNEGNSVYRNRSVVTPNRSANRVESPRQQAAPREKAASVSGSRNSSRTEVKQASPNVRQSQSSSGENKKETENRRRR